MIFRAKKKYNMDELQQQACLADSQQRLIYLIDGVTTCSCMQDKQQGCTSIASGGQSSMGTKVSVLEPPPTFKFRETLQGRQGCLPVD